jgi:hypothetical protein
MTIRHSRRNSAGVVEVLDPPRYLAHARRKGREPDLATCLLCLRTWDDSVVTARTPAQQCPYACKA